ncbi:unnamed protein product, partial [Closterium sp. Naga37s-1]
PLLQQKQCCAQPWAHARTHVPAPPHTPATTRSHWVGSRGAACAIMRGRKPRLQPLLRQKQRCAQPPFVRPSSLPTIAITATTPITATLSTNPLPSLLAITRRLPLASPTPPAAFNGLLAIRIAQNGGLPTRTSARSGGGSYGAIEGGGWAGPSLGDSPPCQSEGQGRARGGES